MKVLSVKIPEDYAEKFKDLAKSEGIEQKELFQKLLDHYLTRDSNPVNDHANQEKIDLLQLQLREKTERITQLESSSGSNAADQATIDGLRLEISTLNDHLQQALTEKENLAEHAILLTEKENRFLSRLAKGDIKDFILYSWIIKFIHSAGRKVTITFSRDEMEAYNEFMQE